MSAQSVSLQHARQPLSQQLCPTGQLAYSQLPPTHEGVTQAALELHSDGDEHFTLGWQPSVGLHASLPAH